MQIFYTPDIVERPELPEDEAHHALRVLRLREGDELLLTDGRGFFYRAVLLAPRPRQCAVRVLERYAQPPLRSFHLHIAVAPTKQMERMGWFCEKATEIGLDAITFLHCRFSERHDIQTSRLEKILTAAMKQSGKALRPVLSRGMAPFSTFIRQPFAGNKYIAHCRGNEKPLLAQIYPRGSDALILTGPEGDFSPEEIDEALALGFQPISLGQSRLRTETAALAACHTLHVLNSIGD
ncbi:MAG: 16S rRNA (uracil(1498)-N(3))-methyltransferase [Tannerellaceae bacterium]|jgi:16S rRNA (uracil1498-N3)-methyltransferase|nr:16S rRNA (uracil(1498)-N(3))-methyltransferase [Tannerellaceae bacterium]